MTDQNERKKMAEAGQAVATDLKAGKQLISWAKANGLYVHIGRPGSVWQNPYPVDSDNPVNPRRDGGTK